MPKTARDMCGRGCQRKIIDYAAYVEDLYANGLQEYIDLMAKFTAVD